MTSPTFGIGSLTNLIKLISTAGLNPKSSVMLPLSSPNESSWSPPEPGSLVGSSFALSVITLDQTPSPIAF